MYSLAACERDWTGSVVDPLTLQEISPDDLISFQSGEKIFCFSRASLYRYIRTTGKLENPLTRQILPVELIRELEDYGQEHARTVDLLGTQLTLDGFQTIGELILEVFRHSHVSGQILEEVLSQDLHLPDQDSLYNYDLEAELTLFPRSIRLESVPLVTDRKRALRAMFDFVRRRRDSGSVYEALEGVLGSELELVPQVPELEYQVQPHETVGEILITLLRLLPGGVPGNLFRWNVVLENGTPLYTLPLDRLATEIIPAENIYQIPFVRAEELDQVRTVMKVYFFAHSLRAYRDLVIPQGISLVEAVRSQNPLAIKDALARMDYDVVDLLESYRLAIPNETLFLQLIQVTPWKLRGSYSWTINPDDLQPVLAKVLQEGTLNSLRKILQRTIDERHKGCDGLRTLDLRVIFQKTPPELIIAAVQSLTGLSSPEGILETVRSSIAEARTVVEGPSETTYLVRVVLRDIPALSRMHSSPSEKVVRLVLEHYPDLLPLVWDKVARPMILFQKLFDVATLPRRYLNQFLAHYSLETLVRYIARGKDWHYQLPIFLLNHYDLSDSEAAVLFQKAIYSSDLITALAHYPNTTIWWAMIEPQQVDRLTKLEEVIRRQMLIPNDLAKVLTDPVAILSQILSPEYQASAEFVTTVLRNSKLSSADLVELLMKGLLSRKTLTHIGLLLNDPRLDLSDLLKVALRQPTTLLSHLAGTPRFSMDLLFDVIRTLAPEEWQSNASLILPRLSAESLTTLAGELATGRSRESTGQSPLRQSPGQSLPEQSQGQSPLRQSLGQSPGQSARRNILIQIWNDPRVEQDLLRADPQVMRILQERRGESKSRYL